MAVLEVVGGSDDGRSGQPAKQVGQTRIAGDKQRDAKLGPQPTFAG
jgi:hypothetical protein